MRRAADLMRSQRHRAAFESGGWFGVRRCGRPRGRARRCPRRGAATGVGAVAGRPHSAHQRPRGNAPSDRDHTAERQPCDDLLRRRVRPVAPAGNGSWLGGRVAPDLFSREVSAARASARRLRGGPREILRVYPSELAAACRPARSFGAVSLRRRSGGVHAGSHRVGDRRSVLGRPAGNRAVRASGISDARDGHDASPFAISSAAGMSHRPGRRRAG